MKRTTAILGMLMLTTVFLACNQQPTTPTNPDPEPLSLYATEAVTDSQLTSCTIPCQVLDITIKQPGTKLPIDEQIKSKQVQVKFWPVTMDIKPRYNPGEDRLAYSVACSLMSADLAGQGHLLSDDYQPAYGGIQWSPSGQYIAFTSEPGLTIISGDGQEKKTISAFPRGLADDFSWSSDSKQVIMVSYQQGMYLYDLPTDQSQLIFQSWLHGLVHDPVFSPGDSLIAFAWQPEQRNLIQICLMKPNGTDCRPVSPLLETASFEDLNLSWISDHELVFSSSMLGAGGLFYHDISQAAPEKSKPWLAVPCHTSHLAVSPDRQQLAVATEQGLLIIELSSWTSYATTAVDDIQQITWLNNQNLVYRTGHGIHLLELDGQDYQIIAFSHFEEFGGLSTTH
ncbi:hypothetical protein KKF61_06570 [Patescibacteria group bacterium]|nr:hypothetical protein [Patescibacteria group bacterium]MBU0964360.1 hypothetical protein [Patescibacteria group bacterium]